MLSSLWVYTIPKGFSIQFQDKSDEPYFITELGPDHIYKLLNCAANKTIKSLINVQHVRLYHEPRLLRREDEMVDNRNRNVDDDSPSQHEPQEIINSQKPTVIDEMDTGKTTS